MQWPTKADWTRSTITWVRNTLSAPFLCFSHRTEKSNLVFDPSFSWGLWLLPLFLLFLFSFSFLEAQCVPAFSTPLVAGWRLVTCFHGVLHHHSGIFIDFSVLSSYFVHEKFNMHHSTLLLQPPIPIIFQLFHWFLLLTYLPFPQSLSKAESGTSDLAVKSKHSIHYSERVYMVREYNLCKLIDHICT